MTVKMKSLPIFEALLAAILFASSTPLSKLLIGDINPIPMAAFLYLGSGAGAFLIRTLMKIRNPERKSEAKLTHKDLPWLLGAIISGGVLAPIVLLFGLRITPASTASLLLNFEGVATALIAAVFFKEAIGKRVTWSIVLITLASIILSFTWGEWGFSLGIFLILGACVFWGIDNNFTRNISDRDPLQIVMFKGLGAGSFSLILALVLNTPMPKVGTILLASGLGVISYGLSIALIIRAMRGLGSARAYAWYGSAPFISLLLSLIIFRERPSLNMWVGLGLMIIGAWLMVTERHSHLHVHPLLAHEHAHQHPDAHHTHTHEGLDPSTTISHSHLHEHDPLEHEHEHTPDIHHRHEHEDS
jgi:drug/metabolite transporter (DMT)-like permease